MPSALFNYVIISNTLPGFFRSKIGEKTFKNLHEFPVTNFGRHCQKIFTTNFVQDFLSVKANRERSSIFISFSCLFCCQAEMCTKFIKWMLLFCRKVFLPKF